MESCLICENSILITSTNGNYKICNICHYIKTIKKTLYIKYNTYKHIIDDKCDIIYYYDDDSFLDYIKNIESTCYDNIIIENVMNYTDNPAKIIQILKTKLKTTGEFMLITKKFNMSLINNNSSLNYFNIYSMNVLCKNNNLELYKINSHGDTGYPQYYIFICKINDDICSSHIPHEIYDELYDYTIF
jgi:hypothetical protein